MLTYQLNQTLCCCLITITRFVTWNLIKFFSGIHNSNTQFKAWTKYLFEEIVEDSKEDSYSTTKKKEAKRSSQHQYIFKFKSPFEFPSPASTRPLLLSEKPPPHFYKCISPHGIQRSIKKYETVQTCTHYQRMLLSFPFPISYLTRKRKF